MFVPTMAMIIKYARSKIIVKLLYTIHLDKQLGPTLRAGLARITAKHLEGVPVRSFPFIAVDLGITCVNGSRVSRKCPMRLIARRLSMSLSASQ